MAVNLVREDDKEYNLVNLAEEDRQDDEKQDVFIARAVLFLARGHLKQAKQLESQQKLPASLSI